MSNTLLLNSDSNLKHRMPLPGRDLSATIGGRTLQLFSTRLMEKIGIARSESFAGRGRNRYFAPSYGKIRQNLFWAFIYNLVSIPLAAMAPPQSDDGGRRHGVQFGECDQQCAAVAALEARVIVYGEHEHEYR